jgi:hypothetical protein
MLEELKFKTGPVELVEAVSVTVPLKLLRLVTVIVEFTVSPACKFTLDGLAVMEKSGLKNSFIANAF